jgi:hypothetical protein
MARPPAKKMRWDRVILLIVVVAAIGAGGYLIFSH